MYWHINHVRLTLPVKQETEPALLPGLPSLGLSDLHSILAQSASNSASLAVIMENFGCLEKMTGCSVTVLRSWKVRQLSYISPTELCLTRLLTMVGSFFFLGIGCFLLLRIDARKKHILETYL